MFECSGEIENQTSDDDKYSAVLLSGKRRISGSPTNRK